MNDHTAPWLASAALAGACILASCGAVNPATSPSAPAITAAPAGRAAPDPTMIARPTTAAPAAEAGGEAGGTEAALVTYTDAQQRFTISHPGPWTQDPAVTSGVQFNGGNDSMRLEFATLAAGADVQTFAKQDLPIVTTAFPGFAQVGLAPSPEVAKAVVLGFTANGTSAVTGKPYAARGDRYYIPLSDGRLAVLTVLGPATAYDREGVRDIALTLKAIK